MLTATETRPALMRARTVESLRGKYLFVNHATDEECEVELTAHRGGTNDGDVSGLGPTRHVWQRQLTPRDGVLSIFNGEGRLCCLELCPDGILRGRLDNAESYVDPTCELIPLDLPQPATVDISNCQLQTWTPDEAAKVFPTYKPDWALPVGTRGNGMIWLLDPTVERSDLDSCGIDHEDWILPYLDCPPGSVCLDLASFIGTNAVWWAKRGVKVISCEPMPRSRELLLKNIALNGVGDKIKVIPKAFGSAPGMMRMHSSLHYASYIGQTGDTVVEVTTVDAEILPTLSRLDCIKLDVEGAECEVIDGARETIKRFRPRLVIEVHSHMDGRSHNGNILAAQLRELNYSFKHIWHNSDAYFYVEATPN